VKPGTLAKRSGYLSRVLPDELKALPSFIEEIKVERIVMPVLEQAKSQ